MFHYKAVRYANHPMQKNPDAGIHELFGGEENTQHNHIRLNSAQCPAPTPQQTARKEY